jgi:hypothetical protein
MNYSPSSYTEILSFGELIGHDSPADSTALDRYDISTILKNLFIADTSILYGTGKLIQFITNNMVEFVDASLDVKKPFALYLGIENSITANTNMQANSNSFSINYRIEGLLENKDTIGQYLDDIDKRLTQLIETQVHTGRMFTEYYSVSTYSDRIIDATRTESRLTFDVKNDQIIAECVGAFTISVFHRVS